MNYVLLEKDTLLFLGNDGTFGALEDARLFTPLAAAAIAFVYGDDFLMLKVVGATGHPTARMYPSLS
jgi:hypothetical protein